MSEWWNYSVFILINNLHSLFLKAENFKRRVCIYNIDALRMKYFHVPARSCWISVKADVSFWRRLSKVFFVIAFSCRSTRISSSTSKTCKKGTAKKNLFQETNFTLVQNNHKNGISSSCKRSPLCCLYWCSCCDEEFITEFIKAFSEVYFKTAKKLYCIVLEVSINCFCVRFLFKHEGELYKEVFSGNIKAHLSVTVDMRG